MGPGGFGAVVRLIPWMLPAAGCIAAALVGLGILLGRIPLMPPNKGAIEVKLIPPPPKPPARPVNLAPMRAAPIVPRPKPRIRPKPRVVHRSRVKKPPATPPPAAVSKLPSPAVGKPTGSANSLALPSAGSSTGKGTKGGSALSGSGSSSSGARAIYAPLPKIPDDMRDNPFKAVAIARFVVSADGDASVTLVQPTPYPRLNELLLQALKNWRFFPAVEHGKPVASTFEIRIPFVVD